MLRTRSLGFSGKIFQVKPGLGVGSPTGLRIVLSCCVRGQESVMSLSCHDEKRRGVRESPALGVLIFFCGSGAECCKAAKDQPSYHATTGREALAVKV